MFFNMPLVISKSSIAGATPKLIISLRLSACLPKSLEIFNFLAKYPSKKSKNEAKIINKHPKFTNPFEKKTIAISPHNKFKIVK